MLLAPKSSVLGYSLKLVDTQTLVEALKGTSFLSFFGVFMSCLPDFATLAFDLLALSEEESNRLTIYPNR